MLRSLALKGRRFETWEQFCEAVREVTANWNAHKHPSLRGRRRRHRPRRQPDVALGANVRVDEALQKRGRRGLPRGWT